MAKVIVVGLGPGPVGQISLETYELLQSGMPVFLRTASHPCVNELKQRGLCFDTFDMLYEHAENFEQVYQMIVDRLIQQALKNNIVYAVPGHPLTAEKTVSLLLELAPAKGVEVEVKTAVSFLDSVFISLSIDPLQGVSITDGFSEITRPVYSNWLIVAQVYNRLVASERKLDLMRYYPDEHKIYIINQAGTQEQKVLELSLYELDRGEYFSHLTCLALPPLEPEKQPYDWDKLLGTMAKLRSPEGCPWDREQTHTSLRSYLIEECYEVLEALDLQDMHKLCEELGDLLLQIVFHAQLADETGDFGIEDVISEITRKLIRRHPHVFAGTQVKNAEEVSWNWDKIKQQEKGVTSSVFSGLTRGMPALMFAGKAQAKAAKVGFDWPNQEGPIDKIREELGELLAADSPEHKTEELGDLLFAVVNLSRFMDIDPELALLQSVDKFIKRFAYIEQVCIEQGRKLQGMALEELDELWDLAKKQ